MKIVQNKISNQNINNIVVQINTILFRIRNELSVSIMETSDSEIESGEPRISKKKKADLDPFTEVEFLDLSNLSGTGFEDVSESDLLAISANENSFPPTQQKENSGSLLNMTVSVPIGHFKNKQFHFVGVFYIRLFRSQHLTDPILHKDVYGNCIRSVMTCIWEASKNSIAREIKVVYNDNEQLLRWSTKECPDETDLDKFVLLKHEKTRSSIPWKTFGITPNF
ncbi:uncharacterized protein LOC134207002 [Armigeres subalbatus]|uniref:uncharacterized protein LOC134207002 n=1 Tax=Armigeres subalbatus TaxID=124917 RepID=UPI002ED1179C